MIYCLYRFCKFNLFEDDNNNNNNGKKKKKKKASTAGRRLSEPERVEQWHQQGNVWPPQWQPESDHKKRVMAQREEEVMSLGTSDERWENWLQLTQARYVPSFTPQGFKKTKLPKYVFEKLMKPVRAMDFDSLPSEGNVDVIYSDMSLRPKMLHIGALAYEVLEDLRPLHEVG